MGFWSLRNPHTYMLLIVAFLSPIGLAMKYYPDQTQNTAYVSVGLIVFLIAGLPFIASRLAGEHQHLELTVRHPSTGVASSPIDFFISNIDPSHRVRDLIPLMGRDKKGNDIPFYSSGDWYYPYLARAEWGVDIFDYHGRELVLFVFPAPEEKFLTFGRRVDGAILFGEVLTHGSSEHVEAYMAPFKQDFMGVDIPILLGVSATYTWRAVTKDWTECMNALAKVLPYMDEFMEQNKELIFPAKQIDEITVPKEKALEVTVK